jgi:hypothetical protein
LLNPERNDVDISVLFKWGKKVDIYDVNNQVMLTCYLRLVGDADMNRARTFALRRSAELRKKLRDFDSDERIAYIAEKSAVSKEELVRYILLLENKSFAEEAYSTVKVVYPVEPATGASLEDQEEYQKKVDSFRDDLNKLVEAKVLELAKKEEDKLMALKVDKLYERYEQLAINDMCETEMLNAFRDACVYSGSYKDENYKTRLFSSTSEFQELPNDIKKQFEAEYDSLEINMENLKKSPEATL